jgi:hypothetical protein
MISINPHFITDNHGKKISAILPINEFEMIIEELEELEDIKLYDEGKEESEPSLSRDDAMALLEEERKKGGR